MGGLFNNGLSADGATRAQRLLGVGRDTILPTVLRVAKEELEYWTNMTCFYDKQWEFNPKFSTVPISFMHITKVTEITTAQGSEKRVIVYEDTAPTLENTYKSAQAAHRNNLEVIQDNVVVQPKIFQMEVIIPDSLIGPYHRQGLSRLSALVEYMQRTSGDEDKMKTLATGLGYAQTAIDVFDTAASVLDTVLGAFGSSSQMETMNKNSIDAMAGAGHVVLFKKWTGYDYSYGIITKLEVSKRPTEEGVYRGSITFQETPILNISPKKVKATMSIFEMLQYGAAQTARVLNLAMAYPFIKLTGVMDEAGAPGTDGPAEPLEFTGGNIF